MTALRAVHNDRTAGTRHAIMTAAERLFAEHGLSTVSHRQIAEAAGQRNNAVVGYHFGDKTELVRAIMTLRGEQTDHVRRRYVAALVGGDSGRIGDCGERGEGGVAGGDIRDWVDALVRPVTEHLASLDTPSWNARLTVQVMTDPTMRELVSEEACARPYLRRILDGLGRCLADLPAGVRAERGAMARHLINHMCAERERALAEGADLLHESWDHTADALTDAVVGLLTAPVTAPRA